MTRLNPLRRLLDAANKYPDATLSGLGLALFGLSYVLKPKAPR